MFGKTFYHKVTQKKKTLLKNIFLPYKSTTFSRIIQNRKKISSFPFFSFYSIIHLHALIPEVFILYIYLSLGQLSGRKKLSEF